MTSNERHTAHRRKRNNDKQTQLLTTTKLGSQVVLGCDMGVESLTWYIAWMQEYLITSSIAYSVVTRRTS